MRSFSTSSSEEDEPRPIDQNVPARQLGGRARGEGKVLVSGTECIGKRKAGKKDKGKHTKTDGFTKTKCL